MKQCIWNKLARVWIKKNVKNVNCLLNTGNCLNIPNTCALLYGHHLMYLRFLLPRGLRIKKDILIHLLFLYESLSLIIITSKKVPIYRDNQIRQFSPFTTIKEKRPITFLPSDITSCMLNFEKFTKRKHFWCMSSMSINWSRWSRNSTERYKYGYSVNSYRDQWSFSLLDFWCCQKFNSFTIYIYWLIQIQIK